MMLRYRRGVVNTMLLPNWSHYWRCLDRGTHPHGCSFRIEHYVHGLGGTVGDEDEKANADNSAA